MKQFFFTLVAACILVYGGFTKPALGDAPLPGRIQVAFTSKSVTLGEPFVLKYKITNVEDRGVFASPTRDYRDWARMTLTDSSGHAVPAIAFPPPAKNEIYEDPTILVPANGVGEGCIVVSRQFQPTHPGQYQLSISTHLLYSWDDLSGEKSIDDQTLTVLLTILPRDPKKLLAVAQSLRQEAVQDNNVGNRQLALQLLFTMRDPICLPVWRALATDPSLDASRAVEVAKYLGDAETTNAADILAAMQTIKPERWSQVGQSPQGIMQRMQMFAAPEVKQHLAQLLPEPVPLRNRAQESLPE